MLFRHAPWLAFVLGLLLSIPAGAQSIEFSPGSQNVIRRHMDPDLDSDQINRQNCLDNELIDFRMRIRGGNTSLRLGAWTGTGCDSETSRSGTNPTCVRVGADIPVVENAVLQLSVQDIVSAVERTVATGDTGEGGAGSGDPGVCDGAAHPVGFTLNFLVLDTSGRAPSGSTGATWEGKYDLMGPEAPTGVTVGVGENRLIVSWTAPSDTPQAELDGFYFFCDPPPGSGTPVDGGIAACGEPSTDPANACGRVLGGAANNGETNALTNGVRYGVSVSARDTFNNYGELSERACGTPEPVTGFFEAYREAGGKAGGGFCSIGGDRSSALAGLGALALLGLALRRRSALARKGSPS